MAILSYFGTWCHRQGCAGHVIRGRRHSGSRFCYSGLFHQFHEYTILSCSSGGGTVALCPLQSDVEMGIWNTEKNICTGQYSIVYKIVWLLTQLHTNNITPFQQRNAYYKLNWDVVFCDKSWKRNILKCSLSAPLCGSLAHITDTPVPSVLYSCPPCLWSSTTGWEIDQNCSVSKNCGRNALCRCYCTMWTCPPTTFKWGQGVSSLP